jgi:hypothetical protein
MCHSFLPPPPPPPLSFCSGALIDITQVMTTFMQVNDIANTTGVLHEYLKARGNREEDGHLQTELLEINLLEAPHVARVLLADNPYTFFDRLRIARLCEQAQLFQFALENYAEMDDIRRVIVNTHAIDPDFLLDFFGILSPENCLECLRDLLKFNLQGNIKLVVEVAKRYSHALPVVQLIALFKSFNSWVGLFYYLGALVNTTEDGDIVYKYIEACVKLDQREECVRVCQENNYFDPQAVKDFLINVNFKDPRALTHVCDRFGLPKPYEQAFNSLHRISPPNKGFSLFDGLFIEGIHNSPVPIAPAIETQAIATRPVWACAVCTFDNILTNAMCEMCGFSFLDAPPSDVPPAAAAAAPTATAPPPRRLASELDDLFGGESQPVIFFSLFPLIFCLFVCVIFSSFFCVVFFFYL